MTLSIGVVTCPDHGDDKEKLVELADQSLYRAKHGVRNRVVVAHDPRSAPRAAGA
ncbi:MAG: diguanylate cyclase domain-containing protein [Myxococcaceae bacterium]